MNSFSPNMLKTFEACPKKYYFKYIQKISVPQKNSLFEKGKKVHALANYYLRGDDISKMEKVPRRCGCGIPFFFSYFSWSARFSTDKISSAVKSCSFNKCFMCFLSFIRPFERAKALLYGLVLSHKCR